MLCQPLNLPICSAYVYGPLDHPLSAKRMENKCHKSDNSNTYKPKQKYTNSDSNLNMDDGYDLDGNVVGTNHRFTAKDAENYGDSSDSGYSGYNY